MNKELSIIDLKKTENIEENLKEFFENEDSTEMFTYYNKRPFSISKNHLYTILVSKNNKNIGYGHIDVEDGIFWLGVCVYNSYQRQGIGSYIIYNLLNYCVKKSLKTVKLVVKYDNLSLVPYYESFGFQKIKEDANNNVFMKFEF